MKAETSLALLSHTLRCFRIAWLASPFRLYSTFRPNEKLEPRPDVFKILVAHRYGVNYRSYVALLCGRPNSEERADCGGVQMTEREQYIRTLEYLHYKQESQDYDTTCTCKKSTTPTGKALDYFCRGLSLHIEVYKAALKTDLHSTAREASICVLELLHDCWPSVSVMSAIELESLRERSMWGSPWRIPPSGD